MSSTDFIPLKTSGAILLQEGDDGRGYLGSIIEGPHWREQGWIIGNDMLSYSAQDIEVDNQILNHAYSQDGVPHLEKKRFMYLKLKDENAIFNRAQSNFYFEEDINKRIAQGKHIDWRHKPLYFVVGLLIFLKDEIKPDASRHPYEAMPWPHNWGYPEGVEPSSLAGQNYKTSGMNFLLQGTEEGTRIVGIQCRTFRLSKKWFYMGFHKTHLEGHLHVEAMYSLPPMKDEVEEKSIQSGEDSPRRGSSMKTKRRK